MITYIYKCSNKKHQALIEIEGKISDPRPESIICPECQGVAKRYYPGQKVYGFNGPTRGGKKM